MAVKTQSRNYARQIFLSELGFLLTSCGIAPARSSILAEFQQKKNSLSSSVQEIDQQVGRVIIYMEERLAEELNLEELAAKVNLSKYQLIRRFREEAGTTPWKFLVGKRIEKVKELLEDGISPGQAAVEAGFYDQSHLHKVFREETGLTPKQYQEKNFKNKN